MPSVVAVQCDLRYWVVVREPTIVASIGEGGVESESMKPRITVVGSTMIDLVVFTERVPGPAETLVGQRFTMGFGGKGANQAVMASLLGAEVAMVTSLGDDRYGDMARENFMVSGLGTSHIQRVRGATGVASIWVEADGTNRIIVVPGANDALTAAHAAAAVRSMPTTSVVVGQLEVPQAATAGGFRAARDLGMVTVLNPAPAAKLDRELLDAATWLIPNEVEFSMLAGRDAADDDALVAYARDNAIRLLVTLGEDGVALVEQDGSVLRIAADTRRAVDTTGAGDAFVGAFSYGLAAGMGTHSAIALGMACSGESVTRPGTQASFPDRVRSAELRAGLEKGPESP